jgi:hypothetical protein
MMGSVLQIVNLKDRTVSHIFKGKSHYEIQQYS